MRGRWVYDPHKGGTKVPVPVRQSTEQRIRAYADAHHGDKFTRLGVRFRGPFCYIDAFTEPVRPSPALLRLTGETREECLKRLRETPSHLCRLRYSGAEDAWSMALYTYSQERYEPCDFRDGSCHGTPEDAFEIAAAFLEEL